jgi:hypothetical protein
MDLSCNSAEREDVERLERTQRLLRSALDLVDRHTRKISKLEQRIKNKQAVINTETLQRQIAERALQGLSEPSAPLVGKAQDIRLFRQRYYREVIRPKMLESKHLSGKKPLKQRAL